MEQDKYQQYLQERKIKAFQDKVASSEIPPEFLCYSMDGSNNTKHYDIMTSRGIVNESKEAAFQLTKEYIQNIQTHKQQGKGIFFYGDSNRQLGMSLLGTFILRAAMEMSYTSLFVSFPSFCEEIDWEGDSERRDKFSDVDFLMVDSISITSLSPNYPKIINGFSDIMLYRRKHEKPTIFASYVAPQILSSRFFQSLISYLDNFIIKCEITYSGDKNKKAQYRIDDLISFLKERRKEKHYYSREEIEILMTDFELEHRIDPKYRGFSEFLNGKK